MGSGDALALSTSDLVPVDLTLPDGSRYRAVPREIVPRGGTGLLWRGRLLGDDPFKDVYGDHTGAALRYGRRLGSRFGVAVEVGERSASGSTPVTDSPAEVDTTHAAVTARWHFKRDAASPWDSWLGAGVLYQSVEETIRFPGDAVSGDDTATGALLGLGLRWTGRRGWGFGGELRLTRLAVSSDVGEGVDLDALEVLAGLGYSF
ncbi:MAG: outer membrane beta-barrel protein [Thermoanaerobaculia bacterium]